VSRWPVAGPSEYWLLASSPASKVKTAIHIRQQQYTQDILKYNHELWYMSTYMMYTVSHQVWIHSGSNNLSDRTVSSLSCPYVIPKSPYFYNKLPDDGPLRLETCRGCPNKSERFKVRATVVLLSWRHWKFNKRYLSFLRLVATEHYAKEQRVIYFLNKWFVLLQN